MRIGAAGGRLFIYYEIQGTAILLLFFALSGTAFAAERAEGKPCGACAKKLAASISLMESAGVKIRRRRPRRTSARRTG